MTAKTPFPQVGDDRTLAQYFFEIGYGSCFAEALIQCGNLPFKLSDALVERAWEIAPECADGPEFDANKAMAEAAPELLEACQAMQQRIVEAMDLERISPASALEEMSAIIDAAIKKATQP